MILVYLLSASKLMFYPTVIPNNSTLSLHDALPISSPSRLASARSSLSPRTLDLPTPRNVASRLRDRAGGVGSDIDRKSTRLNSSHLVISYAVFCLKKKLYAST